MIFRVIILEHGLEIQNMIDFFFKPKSVVLFGISRKIGKSGRFVLRNMINYFNDMKESIGGEKKEESGEKKKNTRLFIIHPSADEIDGVKCIKDFKEIPEELRFNIDLAIISLPVKFVTDAVLKCIKHNVAGVLIQSGNIGNSESEIKEADRNPRYIISALLLTFTLRL